MSKASAPRRIAHLRSTIQGDEPPLTVQNQRQLAPMNCAAGPTKVFPRIKQLRAYTVEAGDADQGADCHDVEDEHWIKCVLIRSKPRTRANLLVHSQRLPDAYCQSHVWLRAIPWRPQVLGNQRSVHISSYVRMAA